MSNYEKEIEVMEFILKVADELETVTCSFYHGMEDTTVELHDVMNGKTMRISLERGELEKSSVERLEEAKEKLHKAILDNFVGGY